VGNRSPIIHSLPLLSTGANLVCGFAAVLSLLHADPSNGSIQERIYSVWAGAFVVVAFVFDVVDGQLARLFGKEGAFGREFDSLADVVSFGVAPALLVYRILLKDFPVAASILATVYLLSCAVRLARFNATHAAITTPGRKNGYSGLPVPLPAGIIVWYSLSLTMDSRLASWNWVLLPLIPFLSLMMLSSFSYPSDARGRALMFLTIAIALIARMPILLFALGLLYAILPPCLAFKRRPKVAEENGSVASPEIRGGDNPPSMGASEEPFLGG